MDVEFEMIPIDTMDVMELREIYTFCMCSPYQKPRPK